MARPIHKLTPDRAHRKSSRPGLHADGGGLYLQVTPPAACSWIFRYSRAWTVSKSGKRLHRDMGLGPYPDISLATAREMAAQWRRILAKGRDPIEVREVERAAERLEAAKAVTFRQCAEQYIAGRESGWRNAKHRKQWAATLETYAYPALGDVPIAAVDVALVTKVLDPIWNEKPETASRVRGRIESVLNWAKARGYRTGENPAQWKGHLENVFLARAKVQAVEHHSALPYKETGAFMAALKTQPGAGALALEFTILTAARTGEAIGARWDEIDFEERVWTVPAGRMKKGREHRVPLSDAALVILRAQRETAGDSALVFPGTKRNTPISNMTMMQTLRRMGRGNLTVHGFRSTFRDWAAEQTNFPREVAEAALAHVVGDKVEAAYRRGDLFEKRRKLMDAWAAFCAAPARAADVIPIGGKVTAA